MYDDVVKKIVNDIKGCLSVGVYDYESQKELSVFTQVSNHNPEIAAQNYSQLMGKLYDALSYFPEEKSWLF